MSRAPSTGGDVEVVRERVRSRDGTDIGYLRQGSGPELLLVQGAMGTVDSYRDLAQALSPHCTVYRVERRGRGLSPQPYRAGHSIDRDVEDISAVLARTGASQVFGLSSGAVITLEATRTLPQITRAAVYEPPFYRGGISRAGIGQLHAAIERGDLPSALDTALRVSGTAPAPIRALPTPLARLLAAIVLRADDRKGGTSPTLRELLPGIRYDFDDVAAVDGQMASFATIQAPVLLLTGTKSPPFLRQAVADLHGLLPHSQVVDLRGLDHGGAWNTGTGGHPDVVAAVLAGFFG